MQQKLSTRDRAILITLALVLGGFAFRSEALLFLGPLVGSVFLVAWVWHGLALKQLEYERVFSERRAFVGETVELTLVVTNRKVLPLTRLRLLDNVSEQLVFKDLELGVSHLPGMAQIRQYYALSWFDQIRRSYHLECVRRGVYDLRSARVQSGDPFGLFTVEGEIGQADRLIIYPVVKPVLGLQLPQKEPFGPKVADQRLLQDPIYMRGIRPFQPGDSLRHVHWKATARTQELQTRIFEPTSSPNLVLFVNISTLARQWEGIDPVLLERVVSVAASICAYAVQERLLVGLSANGTLPRSDQPLRVMPSRSPQQLTRLLEALAAVRGVVSGQFEESLLPESSRLPWGATLMIVTAVVTPELESVLLRLKRVGRKLVLLSLADAPPTWMRGVVTYHLPGRTEDEVFRFVPIAVSEATAQEVG
jgi:uncharacterized protein (DUF58 family)